MVSNEGLAPARQRHARGAQALLVSDERLRQLLGPGKLDWGCGADLFPFPSFLASECRLSCATRDVQALLARLRGIRSGACSASARGTVDGLTKLLVSAF